MDLKSIIFIFYPKKKSHKNEKEKDVVYKKIIQSNNCLQTKTNKT